MGNTGDRALAVVHGDQVRNVLGDEADVPLAAHFALTWGGVADE
jgi:hypothetical protein